MTTTSESTTDSVVATNIVKKMLRFVSEHQAGDFAGVSAHEEKTQFSHKHKQIKHKGGRPPKDFSLAESFVDLQLLLDKGDYPHAVSLYYYLKRFVS